MLIRTSYYPNEDYLAHFGIQGQKWGIRRYQYEDGSLTPAGREHYGYGSAKEYKKALNKFDQATVRDRRNYIEKRNDLTLQTKYVGHLQKKYDKKQNEKSAARLEKAKTAEQSLRDELKTIEGNLERNKQVADRIIEQAQKDGYTVKDKIIYRNDIKASDVVSAMSKTFVAQSVSMAAGLPVSMVFIPGQMVPSNKYSVKKPKNTKEDIKANSKQNKNAQLYKDRVEGKSSTEFNKSPFKTYSKEEKSRAKSLAENEGRYNLDFIESIQNSKIMYDNDTKAINREYSKFLDDPEDYIFNKSEKLKQA